MLDGRLGIRLQIMTGPNLPAPQPALAAAFQSATVTTTAGAEDGFELVFGLTKRPGGSWDLLAGHFLDPTYRVIVAVYVGLTPTVLIDGLIAERHITPAAEPGATTVKVIGSDQTVKLDLEEKDKQYPNQADSVIVESLLAAYSDLGIVPKVTPTTDVPIEVEVTPTQRETDLQFIRRLATRNGFVFYLTPATIGVTEAYWGPSVRSGVPLPALTTGMASSSNVESMTFGYNALAPVAATPRIVDPTTKQEIAQPVLPAERIPPLATSTVPVLRQLLLRTTANIGPVGAELASVAAATAAPEPLSASGEVDVVRYGNVLRARQLVGVRGAGPENDGTWYVQSVTHTITRGSYRQRFELSRSGQGSLTPSVRV
jgi:phage protein D